MLVHTGAQSKSHLLTTGFVVLSLAGLVAACSDAVSEELVGRPKVAGSTDPEAPATTPTTAPPAPEPTLEERARAAFDALYPSFDAACGSCHDPGTANAPRFLAKEDPYKATREYKGVVVKDVTASRLLVVGASTGHTGGPGVEGALRTAITAWLELEAQLLKDEGTPVTDAVALVNGPNEIDVSKSGTGVDGTKLKFNATIKGTILDISNLQIAAPMGTAVSVKKPQFIVVKPDNTEISDVVDSLDAVDQQIAAGQVATLGGGTVLLTSWMDGAKIRVKFGALAPAKAPTGGGGGGGCQNLAGFQQNVKPVFQQCLGCHGANGGSKGALDLSGLDASPANDAAACGQTRLKADLANEAKSKIVTYIAPIQGDPASTHAGTRLTGDAATDYRTRLVNWLMTE